MPLKDIKPQGILRFGFRLPILLYKLHLGWLLGGRFLMLQHTGRKTGVLRQTVIEVVGHDADSGTYYVCSGFGRKSDWFLNVNQDPNVKVTVGSRTWDARAKVLEESPAVKILSSYAREHPVAFRELSSLLTGAAMDANEANLHDFVKDMPVVAFNLTSKG